MTTTSVTATPEVEMPQHFPSCTQEAIGRRVQWLAQHNGRNARFALEDIMSGLDDHRGFCTCFEKKLAGVRDELRLARKNLKSKPWATNYGLVIDRLTAERDALKAAIEAAR